MIRFLLLLGILVGASIFAVISGYDATEAIWMFIGRPLIVTLIVIPVALLLRRAKTRRLGKEFPYSVREMRTLDVVVAVVILPAFCYVFFNLHRHSPLRFDWISMPTMLGVGFYAAQAWMERTNTICKDS